MKLLPITITGKTLSTTASPAVKGDKDIDALSIAVPVSYEGTNLAQDAWHIRFKLPGGTVHIDPLTDGVPDDAEAPTILTFTYPMQGLIVSQSGNVALQIINVPSDGSSIFQTLPGPSITVSSTLEGPPSADYNAAPWGTYLAQYIAIRDETKQYRDQAINGASSALESASNAEESATAAAGSATNAHNSELAAKGSEEGAALIKGAIDSLVASAPFQAVVEVAPSIPAVAEVAEHIPAVAGAAGSIPTVAGVADELALLAPVADEIAALALIVADITSVSGVKADVTAVAEKLVEVQAVYAKLQAIEAVAGRTTEIDALYAQLDTIAAKANQADLDAVEDRLDTLEGTGEGSVAKAIDDGIAEVTDQAVKTTSTPTFVGIKFPTTQVPSSNPNTLDDYEEGTWTPTLVASTTAGNHTYPTRLGWYRKIGSQISISANISCTVDSAWSGPVSIGGAPFAPNNITNYRSSGSVSDAIGCSVPLGIRAQEGSIYFRSGGGYVLTTAFGGSITLVFSLTYITA